MVKAIYPGTFDPVTNGHVDIVERASKVFDELVVAVVAPSPKQVMFGIDERVSLFARAIEHVTNASVEAYSGLTVEFAQSTHASVIVRGLRLGSDFEYENDMAMMNREIVPEVETVCLFSSLSHQFVSSSRVKEIAALGADVSRLIPAHVDGPLLEKIRSA